MPHASLIILYTDTSEQAVDSYLACSRARSQSWQFNQAACKSSTILTDVTAAQASTPASQLFGSRVEEQQAVTRGFQFIAVQV